MTEQKPFKKREIDHETAWGHHPLAQRILARNGRTEGDFQPSNLKEPFYLRQALSEPWREAFDKCESPIEQLLCLEFDKALGAIPLSPPFNFEAVFDLASQAESKRAVVVYPQYQLGKYRADFVVAAYDANNDSFLKLAIECDGHEFHQADIALQRRDAARDEEIRLLGFRVVRISGADIVRGDYLISSAITAALYVPG